MSSINNLKQDSLEQRHLFACGHKVRLGAEQNISLSSKLPEVRSTSLRESTRHGEEQSRAEHRQRLLVHIAEAKGVRRTAELLMPLTRDRYPKRAKSCIFERIEVMGEKIYDNKICMLSIKRTMKKEVEERRRS